MKGTETISKSADVWAVRRGANGCRAAESSAWVERMTKEEQRRVREDLAKNGARCPASTSAKPLYSRPWPRERLPSIVDRLATKTTD
jgi:hypothetical protein